MAGLVYYRGHKKGAWFAGSLTAAFVWWAVRKLYGPGMFLAARLAKNPYLHPDPGGVLRGLFLPAGVIGLLLVFLAWRVADSMTETSVAPEPRFTLSIRRKKKLDVVVCKDVNTWRNVVIPEHDRYLHLLILGPTGCGKTSRVIKPMVYQDLQKIAAGEKLGITVVEPKGDLVNDLANLCGQMGIPFRLVDPMRDDSSRFNPLEGDPEDVAEATRTVLRSIFGRQEAFFAQVQESAAKYVIYLLKALKGDRMDMVDVVRVLQDPDVLSQYVGLLEREHGPNEIVEYFRKEVLGSMKNQFYQFAAGLRQQLEDISSNRRLHRILTGESEVHMDRHLSEGGVLLINTAMNLGRMGDIFGKFAIMHLQFSVFRRPGDEHTRIPHYLYIDELPRYANPDLEALLALGRSYRCACTLSLQSLSQLELEEKAAFRDIVMTNCRHKIVFGGLNAPDAQRFEKEFGQVQQLERTPTYDHRLVVPSVLPESFRAEKKFEPRFRYTDIMELPKFQLIYRIVQDGTYLPPGKGRGRLVKVRKVKAKPLPPAEQKTPPEAPPPPVIFREEVVEKREPAPQLVSDDGFWT